MRLFWAEDSQEKEDTGQAHCPPQSAWKQNTDFPCEGVPPPLFYTESWHGDESVQTNVTKITPIFN